MVQVVARLPQTKAKIKKKLKNFRIKRPWNLMQIFQKFVDFSHCGRQVEMLWIALFSEISLLKKINFIFVPHITYCTIFPFSSHYFSFETLWNLVRNPSFKKYNSKMGLQDFFCWCCALYESKWNWINQSRTEIIITTLLFHQMPLSQS